jgi:hypothetical protein
MADPVQYTFYGTTIPVLRNCATSAISIFTAAKKEISEAGSSSNLPSEQALLDTKFGDMLPLRYQPILHAKFALSALKNLELNNSTPVPTFSPEFSSFDDIIEFFKQTVAVYDALDPKVYNESAEKSVEIAFESMGKTLVMKGLADYVHGFVVPNAYFHLNAVYMILRSQGFALGKGVYIGCFMSEQQQKDWAPLRG